jgi:chromosome segregation ATPase
MKAKDRQIAELEAERDQQKNASSSPGMVDDEESGRRVVELETVVHQLENRILESEEKFEVRMRAETDLLEKNLAEAREESEKYRRRLEKEMEKVSEIEVKYSAMVETVDGLRREKEELVNEKGKAEELKADVDEYLFAEKRGWLVEKRDLEKEIEEMKRKMKELEDSNGIEVEEMKSKMVLQAKASDESALEEKRELEKALESVRKERDEYKSEAEKVKIEIEEVRSKLEEELKAEASKSLQGEIMTLKSALDEAKKELEEQPKGDNMKSMEFIESAYVPKEDFLNLKDELSEAKRKYAGSLKKRQAEFDQKCVIRIVYIFLCRTMC